MNGRVIRILLKSHKARKMWPPLCYYIAPVGEKVEMLAVSHMISQNNRFEDRRVLDFMLNVFHRLFFFFFALFGLICLRFLFPRPFAVICERHFRKEN